MLMKDKHSWSGQQIGRFKTVDKGGKKSTCYYKKITNTN